MRHVLKRLMAVVAVAGFLAAPALAQEKAPAATVAGEWKLVVESPHGPMTLAMTLKVDPAGKVTGSLAEDRLGTMEVAGTFKDGRLAFTAVSGPDELSFAGKLKDVDTIVGMLTGHGDMAATASRVKAR